MAVSWGKQISNDSKLFCNARAVHFAILALLEVFWHLLIFFFFSFPFVCHSLQYKCAGTNLTFLKEKNRQNTQFCIFSFSFIKRSLVSKTISWLEVWWELTFSKNMYSFQLFLIVYKRYFCYSNNVSEEVIVD